MCGGGSADTDSEAPPLEAGDAESIQKKGHAVENSAFEFDDNANSEEKDMKKITQL